MPDPIPVLFISGTGRTGSTLVGNVLGSIDGAISFGEVRHLWTRGLGQNWQCGCGKSFGDCGFWSTVMRTAFASGTPDFDRIRSSERSLLRLRNSGYWLHWIKNPTYLRARHGHYLDALENMYKAIAAVSGADVIVDSSKTPSYGSLLSTLSGIDLRVLHLVRDPRATAYSWLNPKPSPDRGPNRAMDRIGLKKSALLWMWWNGLSERLWAKKPQIPQVRMRYEDFAEHPESAIRDVRDQLAPELADRALAIEGCVADVRVAHSVSGNPTRMRHGQVQIRSDLRWQVDMSNRDKQMIRLLAWPVMHHYGY